MKGAKGGNRDRIISWLFSEKTRKKREEILEEEKNEEIKTEEKRRERRKINKNNKENKPNNKHDNNSNNIDDIEVSNPVLDEEIEILDISSDYIRDSKNIKDLKETGKNTQETSEEIDDDLDITLIDIFDTSRDKKPPSLFVDEEVVEVIKEQNKKESSKEETNIEIAEINEEKEVSHLFPEVDYVDISETSINDSLEKPELIQISIIEEINDLIRNDLYDLRDIKYRIEVLSEQEQDEVLLENVEKIQKELEILIKQFEEIKKKYDYLYTFISVKDIDFINQLYLSGAILNYIEEGKDGIDNSNTIDQIHEIEEFIDIINGIIEIEKQKDLVSESVDAKLVDFNIRDDEFIKLQDQYTKVEDINHLLEKYNEEISSYIKSINDKIANSLDISTRIETTMRIVPDVNRIIQATTLMASSELIPPTPIGQLFKATVFISAAHMLATAVTPEFEQHEVTNTIVIDYSSDIKLGLDDIKTALGNIDYAFDEISYMKNLFEKEFSDYKDTIPEYDELIKNIFSMEKELTRQQSIVYGYNNELEHSLIVNNQKVKRYENE